MTAVPTPIERAARRYAQVCGWEPDEPDAGVKWEYEDCEGRTLGQEDSL